ncbi:hypothetical protein [Arthrobacter pigmenti]
MALNLQRHGGTRSPNPPQVPQSWSRRIGSGNYAGDPDPRRQVTGDGGLHQDSMVNVEP